MMNRRPLRILRFRPLGTRVNHAPSRWEAISKLMPYGVALGFGVLLVAHAALADGISIGGQDASGQMKEVHSLVTTIQTIGLQWIAPLIGAGLAGNGVWQMATRRVGAGVMSMACGGGLFGLEKIASSLTHLMGS